VYATVISCESFKDKDDNDREIICYHITYEYSYNGITYTYVEKYGNRKTVATTHKKLLLISKKGKHQLVDPSILKENKSGSPKLCFIIAAGFELLGLFAWSIETNREIAINITGYGIGVLFVIISISMLISCVKKWRNKDVFDSDAIDGWIVDYKKRKSNHRSGYSYFPVYNYMLNGELKTYESEKGSQQKNKSIGTKINLYYDADTEELFEKSDVKFDFVIATIFGALGLFVLLCLSYNHI